MIRQVKFRIAKILSYLSSSSKHFGPTKGYYKNVDHYLGLNPKFGLKKILYQKESFVRNQVTLSNCRVNLNPWSFITHDDKLLFNESACYGPNPKKHWAFSTIKFHKATKLKGKTLFLSARTNYWHLLANELCDYMILRESGINLNHFDQIIFEKSSNNASHELYKLFGLDKRRLVSLQQFRHFECDELTFFTGSFHLNKHALTLLRKSILDYVGIPDDISPINNSRIIVTRGSSNTRRWLNEQECINALKPFGFRTIDPAKMSFSEQVSAFNNAEIILGPHGAGLTNILFSCPETKVIEIRSKMQGGEYSSANCYEELSLLLGFEHHTFKCTSIERKGLKGRSIEDADLFTDPVKLRKFVYTSITGNNY